MWKAEKEVAKEIDTWYRIGVIPQPGRKGLKLEHQPKWNCLNSPKGPLHLVIQSSVTALEKCGEKEERGQSLPGPRCLMTTELVPRQGPFGVGTRSHHAPSMLGGYFLAPAPAVGLRPGLLPRSLEPPCCRLPLWQLPPEVVKCRFLADSQTI